MFSGLNRLRISEFWMPLMTLQQGGVEGAGAGACKVFRQLAWLAENLHGWGVPPAHRVVPQRLHFAPQCGNSGTRRPPLAAAQHSAPGLQVDEAGAGDVALVICLVEENVFAVAALLRGGIPVHDAVVVDAVLAAQLLPELGADLQRRDGGQVGPGGS